MKTNKCATELHNQRPLGVPSQTLCNCRHLRPSTSESGNMVFSRCRKRVACVALDPTLSLGSAVPSLTSGPASGSRSFRRSNRRTRCKKRWESMAGSISKLCLSPRWRSSFSLGMIGVRMKALSLGRPFKPQKSKNHLVTKV